MKYRHVTRTASVASQAITVSRNWFDRMKGPYNAPILSKVITCKVIEVVLATCHSVSRV